MHAKAQRTGEAAAPWVEDLVAFLSGQAGVEAVRVDPAGKKISVATLGPVDLAAIEARLEETLAAIGKRLDQAGAAPPRGYVVSRTGTETLVARESCMTAPKFWQWRDFTWPEPVAPGEPASAPEWKLLALLAGVCGAAGMAAWMVGRFTGLPPWVASAFYALAIFTGGWDAAIDTWNNVRRGRIDIHFLMLAVATGAVLIDAWGEAALLLFLFSASGAMEEFALDRTHREVKALLKAAPKKATRVRPDGSRQLINVEDIVLGDRLLVKPGEVFPVDGGILKGRTASDESTLTGESAPVEKAEGDPVFSGTLNQWGAVEVAVHRLAAESTLQKIIRLIQTAQKLKAPSERFTDKFGGGYTCLVLGGCTVMFFVWWLGFQLPAFANTPGTHSAFYRAMTLMVVASPCALVLSIPSAILAAIAWGARHGILFRGGAAIEKLARVDLVALDKTGTLTTGELAVVSYESVPSGREQDVIELACALERNSQHPIARAIVRHGRGRNLPELAIEDFESLTGQGLRARFAGSPCLLGRRELIEAGPLAAWVEKLPPAAAEFSEVWVMAKNFIGRVLLRDEVRKESREVLAQLRRAGIRTVMLTGDRRHSAEAVARDLGLDEVRAGLSPGDKVRAIEAFGKEGRRVAMVGDGVNDAPSLAAAYVSVAMGARGSDAALEQAEVILMNDRIENFLAAQRLSMRARKVIRQNLAVSLGVVVVMVLAAGAGLVPLSVGVFAHEGSTVIVCLNGLRLLFGRNK